MTVPGDNKSVRVIAWIDSVEAPVLITPWSLIHACSGALAALVLRRWGFSLLEQSLIWFSIGLTYEFKDAYFSYASKYHHLREDTNSMPNSMMDMVFNMLGFTLMHVTLRNCKVSTQTEVLFIAFTAIIMLVAVSVGMD